MRECVGCGWPDHLLLVLVGQEDARLAAALVSLKGVCR